MVVGIQISGLSSPSIRKDAFEYLQSRLIMLPESIERALDIPGFIFYSTLFETDSPYPFTFVVTPINLGMPYYINISGGKLEVPTQIINSKIILITLVADEFLLSSNVSVEVLHILEEFLSEKMLLYVDPSNFANFVVDNLDNFIWDGVNYLIY